MLDKFNGNIPTFDDWLDSFSNNIPELYLCVHGSDPFWSGADCGYCHYFNCFDINYSYYSESSKSMCDGCKEFHFKCKSDLMTIYDAIYRNRIILQQAKDAYLDEAAYDECTELIDSIVDIQPTSYISEEFSEN